MTIATTIFTMTPETCIVVHPSERPSKCTVEPLRGRAGFRFHTFTQDDPADLDGFVRLGLGGPELSKEDADCGLLVLDATWRYAERMERAYQYVPVRSLTGWSTAYPRTSKLFTDPNDGLATVEAVFIAHLILGRGTRGLLDGYHWRREFLERNAGRIQNLNGRVKSIFTIPAENG